MNQRSELYADRQAWFQKHWSYNFRFYKYFDFKLLNKIMTIKRSGSKNPETYNDAIIMIDTETSKEQPGCVCRNYVVAWTMTIMAYHNPIVTLYGSRPSELIYTINQVVLNMMGNKTVMYVHNLSYDWVFLRKFMLKEWGTPKNQLNTKPHYPLFIEFKNGLIFKDSLILAQRSLEKWAKDLDVKHKKASGFWDYDAIRNQDARFSPDEKTYIEHDTLAGVECIDVTMQMLGKRIYSMPLTATGIPREIVMKKAKASGGRDLFNKIVPDYDTQKVLEQVFHGGYTHNNRHFTERVIYGDITAYDEASAYPYAMLAYKFPMERFHPFDNCDPSFILQNAEDFAYIFRLILIRPRLKSDEIPMPALQKSKAVQTINSIDDNGRILCADYVEIFLNEIDLEVIMQQYDYDKALCIDVQYAAKDYLPRWFTDYVYQCFVDKTMLKGGDPVAYSIAKAKLNALYGMCVQRPIRQIIEELYESGLYEKKEEDEKELYDKYVKNINSVLPYQWGVWVTSIAFRNLFTIGSYAGTWIYSDTDSCYGMDWDKNGIAAYNESCKARLTARGYGSVHHNNRDYRLGICEVDGEYKEFISVGAKRYAVRDKNDMVKITVAGVPKSGRVCLNDDLHNFHAGLIFDGKTTGKKLHTYFFEDDIYTDANGNERGDSIDLSPGDYVLDSVHEINWESLFYDEIEVRDYDE